MRFVHPFADKEPNMVLIEAIKGAKARITIDAPLVVYKEAGIYTDEIYDIYGY
jgi:tRNA1Val (adenine37-N6)-methyltransferase